MRFIAQELREYMAKLGVRTVDEMVGRTDFLKNQNQKRKLDLSRFLNNPYAGRRWITIQRMYMISNWKRHEMKKF